MKFLLRLFFVTFLLMSFQTANAGVSYCDVLAASDDGSKKGDKKKDAEGEEEPDCD